MGRDQYVLSDNSMAAVRTLPWLGLLVGREPASGRRCYLREGDKDFPVSRRA